ncbi:replicative DNA helicase [Brevibacillus ruminantium]|uniref:Replicative DNA helicase n=1 Tax=Brevibacillus ruminantium TaxID=2950604 RepID=A0ABY4WFC2_9BACL|nr:replicative DNA helicase [Brevibacillus ruminantium]USG64024.1 replicative DNA helicase [Brevibacillus ruminantium]
MDNTIIPPEVLSPGFYSTEAEQSVIGAVFLNQTYFPLAYSLCSPEDMYLTQHQRLYQVMADLNESGKAIDLVTVTTELQDRKLLDEIGGVGYLTQIAGSVPTASNVEHYARIVREKAQLRKLYLSALRLPRLIEEEVDLTLAVEFMEKSLQEVAATSHSKGFRSTKDVLLNVYDSIEQNANSVAGEVTGLPSGYQDLDRLTRGFQRSDLIIIAARPSVGKTAFALNVSQRAAERTMDPIAIFSLEMGAEQLLQRMICAEANLEADRLRTGLLEADDWIKLTEAMASLSKKPIFIDDTPGITVSEIKAKAMRLMNDHGGRLGAILIDYLQLVRSGNKAGNRQEEVSEISRTLKGIARELNVPVIALSQLSRSVEQRQDKRPMMSDIRESGSIEQDADIVAFLYRDDYYDKETENKNVIEIIIAKQRNGPTGTVELAFLKEYNKFVDLARPQQISFAETLEQDDEDDDPPWRR